MQTKFLKFSANSETVLPVKPIIIVPTKTLSAENLKLLRDNDLCVIECKDPAKVKFLDPIPSAVQRTKVEDAAIKLSRILLNETWGYYSNANSLSKADCCRIYVDMLIKGTALDRHGTIEEQRENAYNYAFKEETEKLARQEAREARAKKKAEAAKVEELKAQQTKKTTP